MNILCIVGTRPGIIKMAPLIQALKKRAQPPYLVDVGQDKGWFMKGVLYLDLKLPKPTYRIEYKAGEDISQVAEKLSEVVQECDPDFLVASGDSETALASAHSSIKTGKPLLHMESGFRNYDLSQEGEMNRQIIDRLSSFYFTSTSRACENLLMEGVLERYVSKTGSTLIDTLKTTVTRAKKYSKILDELELTQGEYLFLTFFKEGNLSPHRLRLLLRLLEHLEDLIVCPLHPLAKEAMIVSDLYDEFMDIDNLLMTEPLDYLDYIKLLGEARIVLTDSNGVCEEASYLEKPMLFLGKKTLRPEPVETGTAYLMDLDGEIVLDALDKLKKIDQEKLFRRVKYTYGFGDASERIADLITHKDFLYRTPSTKNLLKPYLFEMIDLDKGLTLLEFEEAAKRCGCTIVSAYDEERSQSIHPSRKVKGVLVKGKEDQIVNLREQFS